MIRIIKSKTYKGMKDQIDRLTKQILKQQNELKVLIDTKAVLDRGFSSLSEELFETKKYVKYLKTILTRNKISYDKKEEKEKNKCKNKK